MGLGLKLIFGAIAGGLFGYGWYVLLLFVGFQGSVGDIQIIAIIVSFVAAIFICLYALKKHFHIGDDDY